MIGSLGALIQFPHSPQETVTISSIEELWELLLALLEDLSEPRAKTKT